MKSTPPYKASLRLETAPHFALDQDDAESRRHLGPHEAILLALQKRALRFPMIQP
jgi:hypothetical protein